MRRAILLGGFLALLTCFGVSCDFDPCGSTPEAFVERSEDFFAQAAEADYPVGSPDWKLYDERIEALVNECYPKHEDALSAEQDERFWKGVGTYYVQRYGKAGARDLLRGVNKQLKQLEGWLERNL